MRDFVLGRDESGEAFMQEHFPIAAPIPSGNGLGFMQFLRRELIPFIETDYPPTPVSNYFRRAALGPSDTPGAVAYLAVGVAFHVGCAVVLGSTASCGRSMAVMRRCGRSPWAGDASAGRPPNRQKYSSRGHT
jgi:hypothetical protein